MACVFLCFVLFIITRILRNDADAVGDTYGAALFVRRRQRKSGMNSMRSKRSWKCESKRNTA